MGIIFSKQDVFCPVVNVRSDRPFFIGLDCPDPGVS